MLIRPIRLFKAERLTRDVPLCRCHGHAVDIRDWNGQGASRLLFLAASIIALPKDIVVCKSLRLFDHLLKVVKVGMRWVARSGWRGVHIDNAFSYDLDITVTATES